MSIWLDITLLAACGLIGSALLPAGVAQAQAVTGKLSEMTMQVGDSDPETRFVGALALCYDGWGAYDGQRQELTDMGWTHGAWGGLDEYSKDSTQILMSPDFFCDVSDFEITQAKAHALVQFVLASDEPGTWTLGRTDMGCPEYTSAKGSIVVSSAGQDPVCVPTGNSAVRFWMAGVDAVSVFVANCFSPFITATKAADLFDLPGTRHDFYDLDPLSASNVPSQVTGRAATPGTDRRCEVSFDGDRATDAAEAALQALAAEGITDIAPLPATHTETPGTALLAARRLNPSRIAVVHVGTRMGPNGVETFMTVERLTPSASQD